MTAIGNVILDIAPGIGNPRNSEGAFIKLKDGCILFVYSKFIGKKPDDDAAACISSRYSSDNGKTWSDDRVIAKPEEYYAFNLMSVSLLRMQNKDIGLFYIIRYGWHDTRLYLRRSADEGETWSRPVCCVPAKGYYETNNDRVVMLSSGRIVVPAAFYRMRGESNTDWSSWDGRGTALFYLSDDDGVTWRESTDVCTMPVSRSKAGLQETGVIELKNGNLWAWFRTDMGYQYESFSRDGGETWTQPQPSAFTSPNSPLSMKRIPKNGSLLTVWNPIPAYQTREPDGGAGRKPLAAAISRDDGITWGNILTLEDKGNYGGYCYTAIHFTDDDAVLLAYCAGEPEDGSCLSRLRIRKVTLAEILG